MNDRGRPEAAHGAAATDHTSRPGLDPFEDFNRALARYSAGYRCLIDAHGSEVSAGAWRVLRLEADDALDVANDYDPGDYAPRRRQLGQARGSTAMTSTKPGRVDVSTAGDDPLNAVDLSVYLATHGIDVWANGKVRCIAPDHEDVHPSCSVTSEHFRCWACGARGDLIDAASLLHGIPVEGTGYWKLRDLIVEALLWAPVGRKEVSR